MLKGHTGTLVKAFLWNLAQRASQIAVTVFTFLASGIQTGSGMTADLSPVRLFSMQSFVVIGANMIPVPGAMGITDYLMLDTFGNYMTENAAASLELLSRSLSFYICIIVCGITVLAKLYMLKKGKSKK